MGRPTIITNLNQIQVRQDTVCIWIEVGTDQDRERLTTTLVAFNEYRWHLAPIELMETRPFRVCVQNYSGKPVLFIPTYGGLLFRTGKPIDNAGKKDVIRVQHQATWSSNPRSFVDICSSENLPFPLDLTKPGTIGVRMLSLTYRVTQEVTVLPIFSPFVQSILDSYTN